ncbi:hypothetical protein HGB24_01065 [Candidatus Saccharibacteria bacterium]|nr:hypothetical protein [Candidatus Saccharibacteria bacterium]
MKKLMKKVSKKNSSELRRELVFAHAIIALLSVGTMTLLTLGAVLSITFDGTLSAIASALLILLTIVSSCMAYIYSRVK